MGVDNRFDVLILGAGSGGIGAAITAARLGLQVILVEKAPFIGGNAAVSGVSVWEMGVGGTGVPFDIYKVMNKIPEAIGIYRHNRHCTWSDDKGNSQFSDGAEIVIDSELNYIDSLRRHGAIGGIARNETFVKSNWHGVPFEPSIYQHVVQKLLVRFGVKVLRGTTFTDVSYDSGNINTVTLSNGKCINANYYIDATGSGFLCQTCGCDTMFGQESKEVFNEPHAPINPEKRINGVSLIYRVRQSNQEKIDSLPDNIPSKCWWQDNFPLVSMVQYPNGDFNVNMLPTMNGNEFFEYIKENKKAEAYVECYKRTLSHWHFLQNKYPKFKSYTRIGESQALGVRETHRIVGEYILKEQDLLYGLSKQQHNDIITIVDHPIDFHGPNSELREVEEPYGVPFRCLIPKDFKNLLISSRGASFSSLAASSCRLSRTMMQLGQAAGTATYLANQQKIDIPEISNEKLKKLLTDQHVSLKWPMSSSLVNYLKNE